MDLHNTEKWESRWIFTNNAMEFSEQLKFFFYELCRIAKEQHGENIVLQVPWGSMDTALLPDVEGLKDSLAIAMQRAWQKKKNCVLQQYDTILQKLNREKTNILKIEVQNFPIEQNFYSILSPILMHMSKCIVTYQGNLQIYVVLPDNIEQKLRETLTQLGNADIAWLETNLNCYCGKIHTEINSPVDNSWQDILVSDAFNEGTFNIFRRYCKEHNLIYMRDLIDLDFQQLEQLHGLGAGKLQRIRERYAQITSCRQKEHGRTEQTTPVIFSEPFASIHPTLQGVSVDILINLGISESLISEMKENGIESLGILAKFSQLEARKALRTRNALKVIGLLPDLFRKDIYTLFRYLLINLRNKHNNWYISLLRVANGQTYYTIGQEHGVTKQRIRQFIADGFKWITPLLSAMIARIFSERPYINIQQIMELYSGKKFYSKIILLWLRKQSPCEYIDYAETFIPAISDRNIGNGIWKKVQNMMDEYTSLSELEENFSETYDYPYIDIGALKNLLEKNGYKVYGDVVLKRVTIENLCEPILSRYFPHGFPLNKYEEFRMKCVKTYGERIVKEKLDNAALDNAFTLAKNIIMCDRGKYTSVKNVQIQKIQPLLQKIVDTIELDALAGKEKHISYQRVYNHFVDELKECNVNNHYLLHGLLKYAYPEQFKYNERETFERIGKGVYSVSLNQRIRECFSSAKKTLAKKDLQSQLGITATQLTLAVGNDPKVFFDGEGMIHCLNQYKYDDEDIAELQKSISNIMGEYRGYCNSIMLWEYLKDNHAQLLSNNNITTNREIAGIAQALFHKEYQFSELHMLQKNIQIAKIDWLNIILYLMNTPAKISLEEISPLADKLKCPGGTKYMLQQKLQDMYIRISEKEFIAREKFAIGTQPVAAVKNLLNEEMRDKHIVISKIPWQKLKKLPPLVGTTWNVFLLRSIVENEFAGEYRIIDPAKTDLRYEHGIIVMQDSPFIDFIDLIIDYWRQAGRDHFVSEAEMSIALQKHFDMNYIPGELTVDGDRLIYKADGSGAGFHIEEQRA